MTPNSRFKSMAFEYMLLAMALSSEPPKMHVETIEAHTPPILKSEKPLKQIHGINTKRQKRKSRRK